MKNNLYVAEVYLNCCSTYAKALEWWSGLKRSHQDHPRENSGETSFMSPWHEEDPFAVNLSYYSRLTDGWEDVFVLPRLASV